jgi:hypothetical protein
LETLNNAKVEGGINMVSIKALLFIVAIVLTPVVVTLLFKLVDFSIGPIVLFYSVLIGPFVGLILVSGFIENFHYSLKALIYTIVFLISAVLFLNYFIWLTHAMGEMDYDLL